MSVRGGIFGLIALALAAGGTWAQGNGSMDGMSGENFLANGRFERTVEAVYPWLGVDAYGWLRKSVAVEGVNMHVDKSNQFAYAPMGHSASLVDLDGDNLPDLVSPDGAGFFWFWKNVGSPGSPAFGVGEVMPLLLDNERSTFRAITLEGTEKKQLTRNEERQKERIDKQREDALERLKRENKSRSSAQQRADDELEEEAEAGLPYPWEEVAADGEAGATVAVLNGYRQLRAVAAPCDWNGDGMADFVAGDAQGNLYLALNGGRPGAPDFRTYSKSNDRIVLKLVPQHSLVTRKTTNEPVAFMNYATPFVVDWNRDGLRDILVGEGTYSVNAIRLFTFPSRSTGQPREQLLMVGGERTFLAPFAADWDGDGHFDLFVNDSEGLLTVFPNAEGRWTSGETPMTDSKVITFEGTKDSAFLAYCAPQPCDWNADGIVDLIWSSPDGRIFYALGTAKGAVEFGAPTPVRSTAAEPVSKLALPLDVSFCAVPTANKAAGGTADASRYFTQQGGSSQNSSGFPNRPDVAFGLMPSWDPENPPEGLFDPGRRDGLPGLSASWGVAPVPFDLFQVIPATAGDPGLGATFVQSWHDPARHSVFRRPRDGVTSFGQGVGFAFFAADGRREAAATVDENLRVAFQIRVEGQFTRLEVQYDTAYYEGKKARGRNLVVFPPLVPMPAGAWISYEAVVPKGEYPRSSGGRLFIRLLGRGVVGIRDVAISTTDLPPTK